MAKRDYYEVLGVSKTATDAEIKNAYRKLARKYHPDVSKEENAEDKFKEVQEAYDVLKNPQKRQQYDQFGHEGANMGSGGFGGFSSGGFGGFEDIFSSFFGGSSRKRKNGPQRGRNIRTSIVLTFEEAAFGKQTTISLTKYEVCSSCSGLGAASKKDIETCSRCRGSGQIFVEQNSIFGRMKTQTTCPDCNGKGKVIKNKCHVCHGEGRIKKHSDIKIRMPSGIDDGQILTVTGRGEAGIDGGMSGDLFIEVHVKKHELFVRDGLDLLLDLPITYSEAALGTSLDVPTLKGKVMIKIPAGTQSGTKFRITGKGVKNSSNGMTGNMYVTVNVVTPTKLTSNQKKILKELSKTDEKQGKEFTKIKKILKKL